jgi:hypothetical protein
MLANHIEPIGLRAEFDKALLEVQAVYGDRDFSWTPLVDRHNKNARTDTVRYRSEKGIVVAVPANSTGDELRFDLLHESVHVLNPWLVREDIAYLEEAAAVAISLGLHGNEDFAARKRKELKNATDPERTAYREALCDLESLTSDVVGFIK